MPFNLLFFIINFHMNELTTEHLKKENKMLIRYDYRD